MSILLRRSTSPVAEQLGSQLPPFSYKLGIHRIACPIARIYCTAVWSRRT